MKMIWFDMDGTIANLYGVNDWLPKLRAYDPSPYAEAEVLLNMSRLARLLNQVQQMGYTIGIISWLSKNSNEEYDRAVAEAKRSWLNRHLASVKWDDIRIVQYGVPKEWFMRTEDDILFDDELKNRENWKGQAYEPEMIFKVLNALKGVA